MAGERAAGREELGQDEVEEGLWKKKKEKDKKKEIEKKKKREREKKKET